MQLVEYANKNNGKLADSNIVIDESYKSQKIKIKLKWICRNNHEFLMSIYDAFSRKYWCIKCRLVESGNRKKKMKTLKKQK